MGTQGGGYIYASSTSPSLGTLTIATTGATTGAGVAGQLACIQGDHVTGEIIEYHDGTAVAYCERCNARIRLSRVPGGMDLARLRFLLEALAEPGSPQDEAVLLREFLELKESYRAEVDALNEALSLLDVAEKVLEARGLHH